MTRNERPLWDYLWSMSKHINRAPSSTIERGQEIKNFSFLRSFLGRRKMSPEFLDYLKLLKFQVSPVCLGPFLKPLLISKLYLQIWLFSHENSKVLIKRGQGSKEKIGVLFSPHQYHHAHLHGCTSRINILDLCSATVLLEYLLQFIG